MTPLATLMDVPNAPGRPLPVVRIDTHEASRTSFGPSAKAMLARRGWPSFDWTWSSPSSSAPACPAARLPLTATSAGNIAFLRSFARFDLWAILIFRLDCLVITALYLGPSGGIQVMSAAASGLRADSMFCVQKSSNAWFLPDCVNCVTFIRYALTSIGRSQFLECPFPDTVRLVLQNDLRLVNIMSLHVVESELKEDSHCVGILDALGD